MSTFHVRYVDKTAMPVMHLVGNGIQTRMIHWNDTFLTLLKPQAALYSKSPECALVFSTDKSLLKDETTRTHSHQQERGVPRTFQSTKPSPVGKTHFFPCILPRWWGLRTENRLAGNNLSTNRMTCANTRSFQINTNSRQYLLSLAEHWASGNAGLSTLTNTVSILLFSYKRTGNLDRWQRMGSTHGMMGKSRLAETGTSG